MFSFIFITIFAKFDDAARVRTLPLCLFYNQKKTFHFLLHKIIVQQKRLHFHFMYIYK